MTLSGDNQYSNGLDETAPRILCLGTHHKTGTEWMNKVFRRMSRRLDIPFQPMRTKRKDDLSVLPETGRVIAVSWVSNFSQKLFERKDTRFIHLIRDPRDVLISGMYYHMKTTNEAFLHQPQERLDGKTYQQYLQSLPDVKSQFEFEMDNIHARTLSQMMAWDYDHPQTIEWRYEDLIQDTECQIFVDSMKTYGLSDEETATARKIFWNHSLFGGLSEKKSQVEHIRSGRVAQWRTKLPPDVAEIYIEKHGDDLIELGYAKDHNWINEIKYEPPQMKVGV